MKFDKKYFMRDKTDIECWVETLHTWHDISPALALQLIAPTFKMEIDYFGNVNDYNTIAM